MHETFRVCVSQNATLIETIFFYVCEKVSEKIKLKWSKFAIFYGIS